MSFPTVSISSEVKAIELTKLDLHHSRMLDGSYRRESTALERFETQHAFAGVSQPCAVVFEPRYGIWFYTASTTSIGYSYDFGRSHIGTVSAVAGMTTWQCAATDGNGVVLLGGNSGSAVRIRRADCSTSYTSFSSVTMNNTGTLTGLCWHEALGRFFGVGTDGKIEHSVTGATGTWTSITPSITPQWRAIAHNGTRLVVVGDATNQALYSDNGTTWNVATLPVSSGWDRLVWVPYHECFIAACSGDGPMARSFDGITWELLHGSTPFRIATTGGSINSIDFLYLLAYKDTIFSGMRNGTEAYSLVSSQDGGETWHPYRLLWTTSLAIAGLSEDAGQMMYGDGTNIYFSPCAKVY